MNVLRIHSKCFIRERFEESMNIPKKAAFTTPSALKFRISMKIRVKERIPFVFSELSQFSVGCLILVLRWALGQDFVLLKCRRSLQHKPIEFL